MMGFVFLASFVWIAHATSFSHVFDLPGGSPIAMDANSIVTLSPTGNFSLFQHSQRPFTLIRTFPAGVSVSVDGDWVVVGTSERLLIFNKSVNDVVWNVSAACIGLLVKGDAVFCGECAFNSKCAVSVFVKDGPQSFRLAAELPAPKESQRFGQSMAGGKSLLVVGDLWWGGQDAGAVYFFEHNETSGDWFLTGAMDGGREVSFNAPFFFQPRLRGGEGAMKSAARSL